MRWVPLKDRAPVDKVIGGVIVFSVAYITMHVIIWVVRGLA